MKESDIRRAKERYEKMLADGTRCYFEPEEIEAIADCYESELAFRKALQAVSHGLRLYPSNEALMLRKSRCLLNLNRVEDALHAIASVSDLCVEYYLIHAEIEMARNNLPQALSYFKQAADCPEANADDCIEVLDICVEYDCMELLEQFTEFCATRIDNLVAYFRELALVYEDCEDDEKAIALYNKILDAEPYSADDWFALAKVYARLQRYPEALEACDFALAIDENDQDVISFKGYCYYDNEQYAEAAEQFLEFARLTSDKAIAYELVAEAYTRMEKHEQAIEYLQKAIRLNDRSHDLYYQLAVNYYYMGLNDRAIAALNKAVACDDGDDEAHALLGELLVQQDEYDEAYRHLSHIPMNPIADTASGAAFADACIHLERYDEAIEVLQQLAEKDPYELHYIFDIVLIYIRLGNNEKVVEWLGRAERLADDLQALDELDKETRDTWLAFKKQVNTLRSFLSENLNEDL